MESQFLRKSNLRVTIENIQNNFSYSGYLFFLALGRRSHKVSRNSLVWPGRSIKIIRKKLFIFKNTTYIINRRIFRALLVQGTFSLTHLPTPALAEWQRQLLSRFVCLEGYYTTLLKFETGTYFAHAH